MNFLFEILIEGAYELALIKRVPLWIRIFLLILLASFYLIILLGLISIGTMLLVKGEYLNGLMMSTLGLGLTFGLSRKLIRDFRAKKVI